MDAIPLCDDIKRMYIVSGRKYTYVLDKIVTDLSFCIHNLSIHFRALKLLRIQKHGTHNFIHSSTILRATHFKPSHLKRHHNVSGCVTNKNLHTKTTFLEADDYVPLSFGGIIWQSINYVLSFKRNSAVAATVCLVL